MFCVLEHRTFHQDLVLYVKINKHKPEVVVSAFNPNTREAEAGRPLNLWPAWSMKGVPGQPELYREILSQKAK